MDKWQDDDSTPNLILMTCLAWMILHHFIIPIAIWEKYHSCGASKIVFVCHELIDAKRSMTALCSPSQPTLDKPFFGLLVPILPNSAFLSMLFILEHIAWTNRLTSEKDWPSVLSQGCRHTSCKTSPKQDEIEWQTWYYKIFDFK